MKSKDRFYRATVVVFLIGSIGLGQWVWSQSGITPEQLDQRIIEAKSKKEHESLAQYFEQEAQVLEEKAERHQKLAEDYEKGGSYEKVKGFMLQHCNAMIRNYRQAAEENLALAKMHRELGAGAP
ncbi:MAG: hypothetical protein ACREUU_05330 [Gammaproteobacteria bacterium]